MPRPRLERLEPEKRSRLLEVAAIEFATKGVTGASLNRILEQAGVSKGAAYYYFDDKADLLGWVVAGAWDALTAEFDLRVDALDAETFWPKLIAAHTASLRRTRERPWVVAVAKLVYTLRDSERFGAHVAALVDRGNRLLESLLRHGQALGVVRTDLPLDLLVSLIRAADEAGDRWMLERWATLDEAEAVALAGKIFDLFRRLAEPPADRRMGEITAARTVSE